MRTCIAERLNCETPIFAFSHCRDVVVEVTKAGGFGVLGAATFSPEQLEVLFNTRTEDAVRRRARTGKTVRMTKSRLSEAWERPGAPGYLLPPLQGILYGEAHARVVRAERADLCSIPAGQVVGTIAAATSVREVMYQLQSEYIATMERLATLAAS